MGGRRRIIQWLIHSYKLVVLIGSINNYFKCDGLKYRDCQNELKKKKEKQTQDSTKCCLQETYFKIKDLGQ